MKKVLFVINTLGRAGAEKALLELLNQFNKEEYQVSLFVLLNQGELSGDIPKHVNVLNTDIDYTDIYSKSGYRHLRKTIFKRMYRFGSLFKNFTYFISNLLIMLVKSDVKIDKLLWRIAADGAERFNEHFDTAIAFLEGGSTYYVSRHVSADTKIGFVHIDYEKAGYSKKLDLDTYNKIDYVFAVSDISKDSFLKIHPECSHKTLLFNNLLDIEFIQKRSFENKQVFENKDCPCLLSIGRLTAQKNHDAAIDTMLYLRSKGINAKWYILGEGNLKVTLSKRIKSLGLEDCFFLLGNKENPYPYLKNCDVYVHVSVFEGKSIAVMEAKALKCPIVLSGNVSFNQIEDRVTGLICDLNPESIGNAIIELLSNKEKAHLYGENAYLDICKKQKDLSGLNRLFEIIG